MKMEEIKQLPLEELKIRLQDSQEELANLRFQLALRQLDNPLRVRLLRRDIARLKTVIHGQENARDNEKPQS
ncbi:50S ribosomal protein L29 [bacterium I07]|nr:50S ribosomal protein L29 [bacterium I07]